MSFECKNEFVYLPREFAKIVNGKQEEEWEQVQVGKTLHYIADMLEE